MDDIIDSRRDDSATDKEDAFIVMHNGILWRHQTTQHWQLHTIIQEMKNVQPAFEKWEKLENELPVDYQKIKCHFIFDNKMGENF